MLVLWKDDRIREWADTAAHIAKHDVSFFFARHPEIRCDDFSPALDDGVSQIHLTIQFKRARLHRQRARGGPRLLGLVDDSHAHAHTCQPQGQYQAGRPGADDQNVGVADWGCISHLKTLSRLDIRDVSEGLPFLVHSWPSG